MKLHTNYKFSENMKKKIEKRMKETKGKKVSIENIHKKYRYVILYVYTGNRASREIHVSLTN